MPKLTNIAMFLKFLSPILQDWDSPDESTLRIKLKDDININGVVLAKMLVEIFEGAADEISVEDDGYIRLWWD